MTQNKTTKDISKPAVIKLLNEAYEKEKRLRAQWIKKHKEEILLAATLNREPTNYYEQDVIKHKMIGGMATITRDHVVAGYNRRKVPIRDARTIPGIESIKHDHSIIQLGTGNADEDPRLARPDTDLSLDPIMHPIDSKIKSLLYRPKNGREVYLRERTKKLPEEKYYFSECSNWDYGWRICDSKIRQKSTYGRIWLLDRTLRSRVGPAPDPRYYRAPTVPGYAKCASS